MRDRPRAQTAFSVRWAALALLAVLAFVTYVRLRVADVPLERDEGEYAYAGQLILEGVPPYALAYNMKFPGTYYAYAAIIALLGRSPWGIHAGLLLVNVASIVLVFVVGRRLLGDLAAAVSAACFATLSIDRWIYGVFAHATHFVALAVLTGLWLLLRGIDSERKRWLFGSGALFGVAVLMKQHAVFFVPFAALIAVWSDTRGDRRFDRDVAKRVGVLAIGVALPLAALAVMLLVSGVWGRFWFWTIRYASAYASAVSLSDAIPNLIEGFKITSTMNRALWALGGLGLVALWTAPFTARVRLVLTGFLAASILAVCPGFYFRQHYFIVALPAAALLAGAAVSAFRELLVRALPPVAATILALALPAGAIGAYVTREADYLFSMEVREISRSAYGYNPFIEAVEVGRYIRERSNENDRIAVLGSEPEIYFYADRKAATGYMYTYALMEPQPFAERMQAEMIREIETAHPLYLVFSWIDVSWLATQESNQAIIEWGKEYVHKCYDPVGVVDIVSESETHIVWGEDKVRAYAASSPNLVYTFRRKSDAPCSVTP